ncbi:wax ester/triacylglycerol synthase family O-acyltransferase [Austwickia chelonae]|uniref:wax ester/triacylglycerol synthase family O-acyltransferase n=1 Tax=Austwickia chelonae TaxID=100225 RepID=UPI000E23C119|nr:wax ester/triacylglycerol synthase family O-acyltransferase [Austwickia chelonae]
MADHLSPLGASFLYLESPTTAMHVGSVLLLDAEPGGLDREQLADLVVSRTAGVRRYRQKVREIPGRIAAPIWVNAADFDPTYHIRYAALPRPGTQEQLEEFVARIMSRPLDRSHPLWEAYIVEGLGDGQIALVTKTHQALVDGTAAVDIPQLLLDTDPAPDTGRNPEPPPSREPSDAELFTSSLMALAARPQRWFGLAAGGVSELTDVAGRVLGHLGELAGAMARTAADPAPPSPLNTSVGIARRVGFTQIPLADFREIRDNYHRLSHARECTVTDVMLTVLTGALRSWLQSRGEPVHDAARVRALVPVSVVDSETAVGMGPSVQACFVDLPVGEPDPLMRLDQIAFQMRRQVSEGRAVRGRALAQIAGFAPSTLHHVGAQLGNAAARRFFNLVVTNVPGPQHTLWAAEARMSICYPIIPLAQGQSLSVGLTSYAGTVGIGFNGDRGTMQDLGSFPTFTRESLNELTTALAADRSTSRTPKEERHVRDIRVYLALDESKLRQLAEGHSLDAGTVRASAVTAQVRQAFPEDDEEDLEYDALLVAAEIVTEEAPGSRAVVAAVDLPARSLSIVEDGEGWVGFEVVLRCSVQAADLVAVHAAEIGAEPDDELLWYDVSELGRLARGEI